MPMMRISDLVVPRAAWKLLQRYPQLLPVSSHSCALPIDSTTPQLFILVQPIIRKLSFSSTSPPQS